MLFSKFYQEFSRLNEYLQSLFLLGVRMLLAVGFSEPAKMKWEDIPAVSKWFAELGFPTPTFLTYLVSSVEFAGIILLGLGLLTRLIAVPLMIIMLTAIFVVHLPHGFACAGNGYEIPLYYFMMLGVLLSYGSGRFGLDHLFFKGK